MVVLPALVALVSLAGTALIGRDARRRPSPDKTAWIIAFALFTLAAGSEVVGSLLGWSPGLVRLYYLSGAMLVVGFLGLGELYLLAPGRIARLGPGIALVLVAVAAALVAEAPVDPARLGQAGWQALERGPALVAVTVAINSVGTTIVAGGAVYSAWQFWRRRIFRHRMVGCLLIALGTLLVASGGTLTRLGRPEFLYVAMVAGISVIFAGYLEARRREVPAVRGAGPAVAGVAASNGTHLASARNGHHGSEELADDPAIAFLVTLLSAESEREITQRCRFWSVEAGSEAQFDRARARRVWAVRLLLPAPAQVKLDRLSAAAQVQLAELYHEVLAPGVAEIRTSQGKRVAPPT